MRVKTVGWLAVAAMLSTSLTVWSLTRFKEIRQGVEPVVLIGEVDIGDPGATVDSWRFQAPGTLAMDGRLGHHTLPSVAPSETYLYVQVKAPTGSQAVKSAPLDLAIVIDRSGSMQGKRLQNAVDAARGMVRRLRDGDVVSIITYNTKTETLVPRTSITASTREQIVSEISGIRAAGDTCISCAIDTAMQALAVQDGMIKRMLLLSDGEATAGIRDVAGFRSLAERARSRGMPISSVGVDVDYNERIMTAIAQQSNGRHYFVENAAGLPNVFDRELESLTRTVAVGAQLRLELAPDVRLLDVFDRTFEREGSTIVVPLGGFAQGDEKTLLAKVSVRPGAVGHQVLAKVRVVYDDLVTTEAGEAGGELTALLSPDGANLPDLDPLVAGRLGRSETAATLVRANQLFAAGNIKGAISALASKRAELSERMMMASRAAPDAQRAEVEADFDRQLAALDAANHTFNESAKKAKGKAAVRARASRAQVRRNAADAFTMSF